MIMKRYLILLSAILALALAAARSPAQQIQDPTRGAAPLSDVLRAQVQELREIQLLGLVAADDEHGIALIQNSAGQPQIVKPGMMMALKASGIPVRVQVAGISSEGVKIEAPALDESVLLPVSFTYSRRFEDQQAARQRELRQKMGYLDYVEFNDVPLNLALRMLTDQSGQNYVPTAAAAERRVSLFLRDVKPEQVVEEICRSHGLWSRTLDNGLRLPLTRIMTMEEFRRSLQNQQAAELSETFTLLYPNVTEVAAIIQGIYADRVYLSLGDEDILNDDLADLSRRFERFNMLNNNYSSPFTDQFNLQSGGRQYYQRNQLYSRGNRNNLLNLSELEWFREQQGTNQLRELGAADAQRIQDAADADAAAGASSNAVASMLQDLHERPPSVYVTVSRRNNMLVVRTADPRVMEDIRSLVKQLDVPTPMVLLEVKVLELNLTDSLNTIFDYSAQGDFSLNGDLTTWSGGLPASLINERAMSFQLISDHFTARMQLLQERGDAKLVATPTLLTANNEVSQLFIGKEVPIVRNVSSQTVVTDNNVVTTPETEISFERVGTLLLITPNINADRTVTIRLLQENSELASEQSAIPVLNTVSGQIQYVPVDVIETRSISGTFVAGDRKSIAVGGLIREQEADIKSGVPILMDIPLLGWFFRSTQRSKTRSELVVLITPYVISTPTESEAVVGGFLQRNTRNPYAASYLPATNTLIQSGSGGTPTVK